MEEKEEAEKVTAIPNCKGIKVDPRPEEADHLDGQDVNKKAIWLHHKP